MLFEINNLEIEFNIIGEILGMGGPVIGKLKINSKFLEGEYLQQPFVFDEDKKYLFLVKFNDAKMMNDVNFSLMLINIQQFEVLVYRHNFNFLYIESVSKDKMTIFKAFHNKNESFKIVIPFYINDFIKIGDM